MSPTPVKGHGYILSDIHYTAVVVHACVQHMIQSKTKDNVTDYIHLLGGIHEIISN